MATPNFDVTSANAQLILTVDELYPSGVPLEMFSTDSMINTDPVEFVETRRGVDGRMVAGVIKNITTVTITLEASSPTLPVMEYIRDSQKMNNRPYECTLTAYFPATGQTRTFIRGVLKSGSALPPAQRTLQPTTWTFDFEEVM